jgi:hypothetical protein
MSIAEIRRISDKSTRRHGSKLFVSRSDIANADNGLYTFKRVRRGTIICEYFGRYITQHQLQHGGEDKHYCVGNEQGDVIISALTEDGEIKCAAGYINDVMNDVETNCEFRWINNRCFIVASQDIEEYEELYVSYGHDYWFSPEWNSEILIAAREAYHIDQADLDQWAVMIWTAQLTEADEDIEVQGEDQQDEDTDEDTDDDDDVIEVIDLSYEPVIIELDPVIIDLTSDEDLMTVVSEDF